MDIKIKSLKKKYGELVVFDNFDIYFKENSTTGILGPSGCGKTTLLNIISGLISYNSGIIEGVDTKSISYIFQEPRLLEWMTVRGNLEFVLKEKFSKKEYTDIINEILKIVNLLEFENYMPSQLSGGMKQRVSIARAFAYPSKLLLMDEPFKGLDVNLKKNLISNFIKLWQKDKKTVIFITHDIEEMLLLADNIYILDINPAHVIEKISIDMSQSKRILDNSFMNLYIEKIKNFLPV